MRPRLVRFGVAAMLLGGVSCARHPAQRTASPAAPSRSDRSNVHQAMARQVRNAAYAGEGDLVAQQLRERLGAHPEDIETRLALAEHYRKLGFEDLTLEHLRLASERFPENPKVALLLAQAMERQEQAAPAAAYLDQFLKKHPGPGPDLAAWLGLLRDELGEYAAGESAHRAALASNPSSARLHNNLGYNLLLQSRRADAIEEFRRALALDPRLDTARNNLGRALLEQGGPDAIPEAVGHFAAAGGDRAAAHNNAGAVLLELERYAEARSEIEQALRLRPDYAPAWKNLEMAARHDGQPLKVPAAVPAARVQTSGAWSRFWRAVLGLETRREGTAVTLANKD